MIDKDRQDELKQLALVRTNEIIESWWWEDTGEWQYDTNMTDEEFAFAMHVGVKVELE